MNTLLDSTSLSQFFAYDRSTSLAKRMPCFGCLLSALILPVSAAWICRIHDAMRCPVEVGPLAFLLFSVGSPARVGVGGSQSGEQDVSVALRMTSS